MPSVTSLALLKSQLNVDYDRDDALLQHKLDAAEAWIANYTGVEFTADPALTEAALQLAAFWYLQREAAAVDMSVKPVPFGIYDVLSPFKVQITGHIPDETEETESVSE